MDSTEVKEDIFVHATEPHPYWDYVSESYPGVLHEINEHLRSAHARANPHIVGGLVCLICGCAKTGKSFALNSLVPYALKLFLQRISIQPSDPYKIVSLDVQHLTTTNLSTSVKSLHTALASEGLFSKRSDVDAVDLLYDIKGYLLSGDKDHRLFLLIDEFISFY